MRRVYASTREEELALVNWDGAQKDAFLRMQFDAQRAYYGEQFRDAQFLVIERDGRSIGRLYIDRRDDEIKIIDIALVPEERNAGVGSGLLRDILDEAGRNGRPVRIHVERFNKALGLYQRLGFSPVEEQGVYFLMEWRPPTVR